MNESKKILYLASIAILISGLMISLSIFLTTWFFFGGVNNRTKAFIDNSMNKNPSLSLPPNPGVPLTPVSHVTPRPTNSTGSSVTGSTTASTSVTTNK